MRANERIMNAFFSLEQSLMKSQRNDIENDGFSFVNKRQLERLLKDQGFDRIHFCFNLEPFLIPINIIFQRSMQTRKSFRIYVISTRMTKWLIGRRSSPFGLLSNKSPETAHHRLLMILIWWIVLSIIILISYLL